MSNDQSLAAEARPHPEADLLAAIIRRDEAAFATVAGHHVRRLIAIAMRIVGEASEAEDIAQETLLRVWRKAETIEVGPLGLGPWLNRVAANLALDVVRRRRPGDPDALETLSVPADQGNGMLDADRGRVVRAALEELPERQRLALTLFHYEELSLRETAEAMEVSEEAVESLLARARRNLKTKLADEWRDLI